jgi:hypothetical protein
MNWRMQKYIRQDREIATTETFTYSVDRDEHGHIVSERFGRPSGDSICIEHFRSASGELTAFEIDYRNSNNWLHREDGPAHTLWRNGHLAAEWWATNDDRHRIGGPVQRDHSHRFLEMQRRLADQIGPSLPLPLGFSPGVFAVDWSRSEVELSGDPNYVRIWPNAVTSFKGWLDDSGGWGREDGPAMKFWRRDGTKALEVWYKWNWLHRGNGPAYQRFSQTGSVISEGFYEEGVHVRGTRAPIIFERPEYY